MPARLRVAGAQQRCLGFVPRSLHDFVVIVEAANQPPVFESNPVTIAQVGEPYVYNIETSDPDGDPVTVSAITIPEG